MSVLIVGGGLAGGAAACLLGEAATVIEREAEPRHKVCGEFLSWEAQAGLRCLGVDAAALGGVRIDTVRLVHGKDMVATRLPGTGLGLSRKVLDEAVLARAAERGARVLRGVAVRRLAEGGAEVAGLGHVAAERVLLATGKHGLRGAKRAGVADPLIGFKMLFQLDPGQGSELRGHVEVVLFPGGYAGLQPIEAGLANLCLLIDRDAYAAAGGGWTGVLGHLRACSPHLARRLVGAAAALERPVAISGIPYGFVHRAGVADPPGVLRIGDQAGVIPSFSGDGMAIALHTAFVAAGAGDSASYHRRVRRDLAGQVGRATLLHRLGQRHPRLLLAAARAWPGALAWIARLTRVPPSRLGWLDYSAATGTALPARR